MTFPFRLEKLRRVRELQEEVARSAWVEVDALARAAETAAEQCSREVEAAREFLAKQRIQTSPEILLTYEAVLRQNEICSRRARERARTFRAQAERLLHPWQECRQDRRALDALRDREKEAFKLERRRKEQAEMDEAAVTRNARLTAEGTSS